MIHVRMEETWDDTDCIRQCIEVKWLSDRVACLLEILSSLFPPWIRNGAVIEVRKMTRCGYVTCVIAIEHRARYSKKCTRRREILVYSVNEAITIARRSRTYTAADTRFFFLLFTLTHAHARGACVTNRRSDISHPVIMSRPASIWRVYSTKGGCQLGEIFAPSVRPRGVISAPCMFARLIYKLRLRGKEVDVGLKQW